MAAPTTPSVHSPTLPSRRFDWYRWAFSAAVVAVVGWSSLQIDARWERLLEAPADMYTLFRLMFTQMEVGQIPSLLGAMGESIAIAWLGTLIAALFAIPISFMAAQNLVGRPVSWLVRQVLNLLRAIPEVILAIAFIPVFGLTPMAGVMALGVGSIGTLGKLCYEIIEGIQPGPIEASDAVGANRVQRLRWGVVPQVMPELTSFVLYRFEINIRVSAVVGLLGAGGIGNDLAQALRFREYGTAGLGLIIVIAGTIAVDTISLMVRRRILAGPSSITLSPEAMAEASRSVDSSILG